MRTLLPRGPPRKAARAGVMCALTAPSALGIGRPLADASNRSRQGATTWGQVAEWLKAADCKSARASVRWFESSPVHHYRRAQRPLAAARSAAALLRRRAELTDKIHQSGHQRGANNAPSPALTKKRRPCRR